VLRYVAAYTCRKDALFTPPLTLAISEPECDIAFGNTLSRLLEPAYEHPNLILDLTAVQFIDSTCLGKLAKVYGERAARGLSTMRLVTQTAQLRRVLTLVNFDKLFSIYATMDDALEAASRDS
jgi:anti-anti-sigma factor